MPENTVPTDLSPAEWTLIQALRALPEEELRTRAHDVIGKLLFYIGNPRCQGMGPEGFPCGEPLATCEECQELWNLLDTGKRPTRLTQS